MSHISSELSLLSSDFPSRGTKLAHCSPTRAWLISAPWIKYFPSRSCTFTRNESAHISDGETEAWKAVQGCNRRSLPGNSGGTWGSGRSQFSFLGQGGHISTPKRCTCACLKAKQMCVRSQPVRSPSTEEFSSLCHLTTGPRLTEIQSVSPWPRITEPAANCASPPGP